MTKIGRHIMIDLDINLELQEKDINVSKICNDFLRDYVNLREKSDEKEETMADLEKQRTQAQAVITKLKQKIDDKVKKKEEWHKRYKVAIDR